VVRIILSGVYKMKLQLYRPGGGIFSAFCGWKRFSEKGRMNRKLRGFPASPGVYEG